MGERGKKGPQRPDVTCGDVSLVYEVVQKVVHICQKDRPCHQTAHHCAAGDDGRGEKGQAGGAGINVSAAKTLRMCQAALVQIVTGRFLPGETAEVVALIYRWLSLLAKDITVAIGEAAAYAAGLRK